MVNAMMKEIAISITILAFLIGYGFYWFSIRPSNIRKECAQSAFTGSNVIDRYRKTMNEEKYESCLKTHGLD